MMLLLLLFYTASLTAVCESVSCRSSVPFNKLKNVRKIQRKSDSMEEGCYTCQDFDCSIVTYGVTGDVDKIDLSHTLENKFPQIDRIIKFEWILPAIIKTGIALTAVGGLSKLLALSTQPIHNPFNDLSSNMNYGMHELYNNMADFMNTPIDSFLPDLPKLPEFPGLPDLSNYIKVSTSTDRPVYTYVPISTDYKQNNVYKPPNAYNPPTKYKANPHYNVPSSHPFSDTITLTSPGYVTAHRKTKLSNNPGFNNPAGVANLQYPYKAAHGHSHQATHLPGRRKPGRIKFPQSQG